MSIPIDIFRFPLNLILLLIWAAVVYVLWEKHPKSGFVRFMLSPGATYWAVGLFLVLCLAIGITGHRWIVNTWPFVLFMIYFQTVLSYVILRGWREATATGARLGPVRWRFLFLHAGLLVTVASAFWGAPDKETLKLQVFKGEPVSEAYREDGKIIWLKNAVTLQDFKVSYGNDGVPSDYEATVTTGDRTFALRVNHPHALRFGEDMYLSGYDVQAAEYCVLQVVRDPWRYGILAGILMMLAGAFMLFVGGPRRRMEEMD